MRYAPDEMMTVTSIRRARVLTATIRWSITKSADSDDGLVY